MIPESILSAEDCAKCEFCCSFRRQSLVFTPFFEKEKVDEIHTLFPEVRFKTRENGKLTIDIDHMYRTDDSEEEALCPFNKVGCILPEHLKPFDCKLWPFRIMRKRDGNGLVLALAPTCPRIRKDSPEFRKVAESAAKEAAEYAKVHPEIIIEYSDEFITEQEVL